MIVFHAKPLLISSNLNWQYESHLNNPNLLGSISKSGLFRPLFKSDSLKLNSKQLLESISKVSKGTLATFASQPKELNKALFAAKKLGLELSQVEQIADGLLDIESSIQSEFEGS